MTGKHHNWHKHWRREGARLVHDSGLAFECDVALGWTPCDDTLEAWQAFELARGVKLQDLVQRGLRLAKEASQWHE